MEREANLRTHLAHPRLMLGLADIGDMERPVNVFPSPIRAGKSKAR